MTIAAWRIAVEAPSYAANDMMGTGAKISGGRWNSIGTRIVYCSSSIALAALESLIAIRTASLPFDRFLIRVDIPDAIWESRETLSPPGGWDAVPAGITGKHVGDTWVANKRTAVMLVPSVIVPDELNILINPLHPDAGSITASTVKRWIFDPRFF